jgi:hypothetical protein
LYSAAVCSKYFKCILVFGLTVSKDMAAAEKQQHNSNARSNFIGTVSNLPRKTKDA